MTGKKIHWNGNFSNGPLTGKVIADDGANLTIRWDDGSQMVAPIYTVSPKYGWRVA